MSFAESNDGQPKAFFAIYIPSSGEPRACLGGDRVESDAVIDHTEEGGRGPALPPSRTAPLVQATGGMNVLGGTVNISGPIPKTGRMNVLGGTVNISGPITFGSSPMQGILN